MLAKAETLTEALPYLQRYAGKTFVVKYGGHAMGDPELARDFAEDVVLLKAVGINPIVVHGGGPQIGAMLKRLGVESQFVGGLRVTDAETARDRRDGPGGIDQQGNRRLDRRRPAARRSAFRARTPASSPPRRCTAATRPIRCRGSSAMSISASSASRSRSMPSILTTLSAQGFIPVVAPIALGADGHTYNINADTMAGAIAGACGATRFFLLTDVRRRARQGQASC